MRADERFFREAIPLLAAAEEVETVTVHTAFRSFDASGAVIQQNLMRCTTEHELFVTDPVHITGFTVLWADDVETKDIDAVIKHQKQKASA